MLVLPIFIYRNTTNGRRRNKHECNKSRKRLAAPHWRTGTFRHGRKAGQEGCQRSSRTEAHSTKEERQWLRWCCWYERAEADGDRRVYQRTPEPWMCRSLWHQTSVHVVLRAGGVWQDLLCGEDGWRGRYQFRENSSRWPCVPFKEAEKSAPTLLFFDEFDAMVPRRSGDEGNQHYDSEVNEFLCMLNNASGKGVYVLAATNHPERIDKAVLRTGRIDEMVYVDITDMEARKSLFALELSKLPTEGDIDTTHLSELTNGYNCSDISYIVKSAARKKFNETIKCPDGKKHGITQEVLEEIIATRSPSVSTKSLREYECVRNEFSPKDKGLKPVTIGFR